MKIANDRETQTEFNDLYDDAIAMILFYLDIKDLTTISDTNKRLRNIAGLVFSRKYGKHLLSIDAFHPSEFNRRIYILCQTNRLPGLMMPKFGFV